MSVPSRCLPPDSPHTPFASSRLCCSIPATFDIPHLARSAFRIPHSAFGSFSFIISSFPPSDVFPISHPRRRTSDLAPLFGVRSRLLYLLLQLVQISAD